MPIKTSNMRLISNKKLWAAFFALLCFLSLSFYLSKIEKNIRADSEKTEEKIYKIGFITDIHGRTQEIESRATKTITYFANQMNNSFHPDFVMEGGDLIEGTDRKGNKSLKDFEDLNSYFNDLKSKVYHVIGNHETRGFAKDDWLKLTDYEKTYYYFDYEGLRTIVLDANENERIDMTGKNGSFYYFSEEQLKWLEEKLSSRNNLKAIVFTHYPPFETPGSKMINLEQSEKLRELFSKYGVSAVFSGHTEKLDFKEIDSVRYFVMPGIERSELKPVIWYDSFSEISIGEETKLKLFYKRNSEEEYRQIEIPSQEYETIER